MFSSILNGATSGITIMQVGYCFIYAILCGIILAFSYSYATRVSKSFLTTVVILPAIVMVVILMVNGNLGVGVAVAGSFSLIRFRSMPGKASDIAIIFLAMATGLATGMGYVYFALISAILISVLFILINRIHVFEKDYNNRKVKITIPEDLDYANIFDEIFKQYTKSYQLCGVKTINLGSMYLLSYDIELKDIHDEKKMIDDLRCRNGNLSISSVLRENEIGEL